MFLAHAGFEWLMSGGIAVVGLIVFGIKIARGKIFETLLSILVWIFLFKIHNGSFQGIMTATFAALLFDLIAYPIFRYYWRHR